MRDAAGWLVGFGRFCSVVVVVVIVAVVVRVVVAAAPLAKALQCVTLAMTIYLGRSA